ncbi:MAG: sigma factor-like helix-turn-helix DNA-binding protein [Candidatus Pacebacteria bacterium]|nr:sigma factor-like helix-turn-helix DNA-binding protein [Candidatus Paceibacterota bacterium]
MAINNLKPQFNYSQICLELLNNLPERQRQVVGNRFGLIGQDPQTLQEIGDSFGITRERVRQIEKEALSRLTEYQSQKQIKEILAFFNDYFRQNGGVKREDLLLADLAGESNQHSCVYFLLVLSDPFHRIAESEENYSFWSLEENILGRLLATLQSAKSIFEDEKRPLPPENILLVMKGEPRDFILSSLEIAKNIEEGPLGVFGLADWPEIKPKGVKDMAYLALKKKGEPLHFRNIADIANDLLRPNSFKKVLPQTLHNELIRDERFVLVGRGIYALKEWGYNNGTVREIIIHLIKNSESGLTKDEIIKGVLGQRLVKHNTILLNLHNKKHFLRNQEGRYVLDKKS